MITKIHKNVERAVNVPLEYVELTKCTLEEAQSILKDTNKVIVGFTSREDFVIFFKGRQENISGMGMYSYTEILKKPRRSPLHLNLLNSELLESMRHHRSTQVASRSGWLRFFTNPSHVGCYLYRVYDVSQGCAFGERLSLPAVSH